MQLTLEQLSYPIGRFQFQADANNNDIQNRITDIKNLPANLKNAASGLSSAQLDTPYRDGGWTVRQVVHHVADSHMNGFIRLKLALTEERPTIKPYDEKLWAALEDSKNKPIELSLPLIEALHTRWVEVLKNIPPSDYTRTVFHPEHKQEMSIQYLMQSYAWHGKHHVAHITSLRARKNW